MAKPDEALRAQDDAEAAAVLSGLLGRKITRTTLRNWRYVRRGPKPDYFCGRPFYSFAALRRFAAEAYAPQPAARRPYRRRATGCEGESAVGACMPAPTGAAT
jgi:hypothetical protein